jgi:hypothetical protein
MATLATKDGLITQSASVPGLVAAIYRTSAGQSIPHATWTIVDFDSRELDTHRAVTTGASWRFTAPVEGVYVVSASIMFAATTTWADGEVGDLSVYKNGSLVFSLDRTNSNGSSASVNMRLGGSTAVRLDVADYIDIRIYQGSGAALALQGEARYNRVAIYRVI